MKINFKRFLAFMLAMVMVFAYVPAGVFAAGESEADFAAVNGSTYYSTVSEALEAAASGETVQLLKDAEDQIVYVLEETILDLNGFKLDADYVACFGDIVDNSSGNTGCLIVDARYFLIQEQNAQLPVNTGAGYLFADVEKFNEAYIADASKFAFQAFVESFAHESMKAGKAASGVTVEVLISWKNGDGTRSQRFAYDDAKVNEVLGSYDPKTGKYTNMFTLTLSGAENLEDLRFQVIVRSETGVVFCSDGVNLNPGHPEEPGDEPTEAVEKFRANEMEAQNAYTQITLGELFTAVDGVTIGNVTATVTDPDGSAATITATSADWASQTIDLTKAGTWTVVIKDDVACLETTITFTVNKVEKFAVKPVAALNAYTSIALGALFEAVADVTIANVTATFTPSFGEAIKITGTADNWADQTVCLDQAGTWTVVIEDDANCVPTEITITVNKVEKFTTKTVAAQDVYTQITLGDLFTALDGMTIGTVTAIVTDPNGKATTITTADWLDQPIDLNVAGEWTVIISDDASCVPTNTTFTVNKVAKFTAKTVAAQDAYKQITLGDLFAAVDDMPIGNVTAVVTVDGKEVVKLTGTADDWAGKGFKLTEDGSWTVVIEDDENCVSSYVTFAVNAVTKFTANEGIKKDAYTQIKLGELFNKVSGVDIGNVNATVTDPDGNKNTVTGNASDWAAKTIELNKAGTWNVVIMDDVACLETTATFTVNKVTKFTAKTIGAQDAYTQITLGDLFAAVDDMTIGTVTATVTDPSGKATTVTDVDWADQTIDLNKDGEWTVEIKDDDANGAAVKVTFTVNAVDKFVRKFNNENFLYRVGNANAVGIGYLFEEVKTDLNLSAVKVTVTKVAGNAAGTYTSNATWTAGTIKFTGTGVVKVTISADGAKPVDLYLEVVSATNMTALSGTLSTNVVLLQDVETTTIVQTSKILYGNGFTINMEKAPIAETNGGVFHLRDGAVLNNVKIIGKEFTKVVMTVNSTDYGVSAVKTWGTVTIENCYISGCRAAVSAAGNELTIKDSVIANGVYANIDLGSGILNLHNVTTINEPHDVNDTRIVGLGIVVNATASPGRKVNITGDLVQYNWISQEDCNYIRKTGMGALFETVFTSNDFASVRHTYQDTVYVNMGILSLCDDFGEGAVTGAPANYDGIDNDFSGVNGYVWTPAQAGVLTEAEMAYYDQAYQWTAVDQGSSFIPAFINAEGLTAANGVLQIEYEKGNNYTLKAATIAKLMAPAKYGQPLAYTVSMDGVDYTGEDIVFNAEETKNYTIVFEITDNVVYGYNGSLLSGKTYTILKELKVQATVIDKGAEAPSFTFFYGTNGKAGGGSPHVKQPTTSYQGTMKEIDGTYYMMPDVNAAAANKIGSKTISNTTVYYPIVDGINVRSGGSSDYDFNRHYPIFKAVTISDNNTLYNYDTQTMPDTLKWVSIENNTGNGYASSLNTAYNLYDGKLCRSQIKAGNAEDGADTIVKFSYQAQDGNTYYYYVGFKFYDEAESEYCFTADTLIMLADGTQKRVDELNFEDKILAWDFFTGTYVEKNISLLVDHGEATYRIANLEFSDGTLLRLIGSHGVFDYDLNKFVYITVDNMLDYVGDSFVQYNADGSYNLVTLDNAYETEEVTSSYSVSSSVTSNAFASGMLTVAPPEDFYNWIEMDGKLHYDVEQFNADVEQYGLYTYEDFADYVTYEQFVDWNGAYLKIPVEKGLFTFEYILELIELYVTYMPQ